MPDSQEGKYYRIYHRGVLGFTRSDGIVPGEQFPEGTDFRRLIDLGAIGETSEGEYRRQQGLAPEAVAAKAELEAPATFAESPLPKMAPSDDPAPRPEHQASGPVSRPSGPKAQQQQPPR